MKTTPHKVISSVILCIALLPLIFAGYIQISEAVIHDQMKEELEQKSLVTIHAKSSQVIWTEKGKEVNVNGNMFDVESYSINGDDIQLTGLFDKDEDALFAQIDNQQQKNNQGTTCGTLILKWFGFFYSNSNNIINEDLPCLIISLQKIQQDNALQNPALCCDTPPPKFSSI